MRFIAVLMMMACTATVDSAGGGGGSGAGGGTANGGGMSDGGGITAGGGSSASGGGSAASGGGSGAGGGTATGGGGTSAGGGMGTGGGYPNDAGITCDGGETFTVVDPLWFGGCTGFGQFSCHGRTPFEASLDLTMGKHYTSLVNVPSTTNPAKLRVKPGDPLGSFVVQKLTNAQNPMTEGGPMPQPVEGIMWHPPNPENLRVLECWIQQGAQDN